MLPSPFGSVDCLDRDGRLEFETGGRGGGELSRTTTTRRRGDAKHGARPDSIASHQWLGIALYRARTAEWWYGRQYRRGLLQWLRPRMDAIVVDDKDDFDESPHRLVAVARIANDAGSNVPNTLRRGGSARYCLDRLGGCNGGSYCRRGATKKSFTECHVTRFFLCDLSISVWQCRVAE